MTNTNTAAERYITEVDHTTGVVTRKDTETGKTWTWPARTKRSKPDYTPKNGVTIQRLKELGHKVRVNHFRWADYEEFNFKNTQNPADACRNMVVVPAIFRKNRKYTCDARGGYTHIHIQAKTGEYICLTSECSVMDQFCYKEGVRQALHKLSKFELAILGV